MDHPKRILSGQLNRLLKQHESKCVGFVLMPDHVHILLWISEQTSLQEFIREWKRNSSKSLRSWYRQNEIEYFRQNEIGYRLWTPKYYSFHIETTPKIEEKLACIHDNPVRAGFVASEADWKWSSARWYRHQQSVGVPIDWVD